MYHYISCVCAYAANIVIAPQDTEISEGNTLILTCVAYGEPMPEISWSASEGVIYNSSRVRVYSNVIEENGVEFVYSSLEICSVTAEDEGRYWCAASSSQGIAVVDFEVTVSPGEGMCCIYMYMYYMYVHVCMYILACRM